MKSAKEMVAEANTRVKTVSAEAAQSLLDDPNTVFVDLRHSSEREFTLDRTLLYNNPVFSSGKSFVFYCASGGRSALAADTAQSMGLRQVSDLGGGFKAWREANRPVEKV